MSFTVFIESGLHAGAVQRLEPGLYTIGSELDSDIVLTDGNVESVHAIMEFDEQGLRLEPAKGAVAVDGESDQLRPGDERYLSLPAKFSIGETLISVRAPKDAIRSRHHKRLVIGTIAAAFIGIVGLYTFGPLSGSTSSTLEVASSTTTFDGTSQNDVTQPPPLPTQPQQVAANTTNDTAPLPKVAPDPLISVDMAAAELRNKLAEASLDGINVIVKKDHLVAKGAADEEKMADWQTVQVWYDGEIGHLVSLVSNVETAAKIEPPKLAIEAIWTGERPYLMAGGQRYFEGASLGDGWEIEQIETEQITIRRGDQIFSITL